MMRVVLKLHTVESRQALHQLLCQALSLPAWYGNNLDALFDCLSTRAEPTELVLCGLAQLQSRLGAYAAAFFRVLQDSAQENPNLTILTEDVPT